MTTPKRKRRLGKGLESLLARPVAVEAPEPSTPRKKSPAVIPPSSPESKAKNSSPSHGNHTESVPSEQGSLLYLAIGQIEPNPTQPRQVFDEQGLSALADSIKLAGLMQPIVVRRSKQSSGYEIIAGERRWRAAQLAGLLKLPAILQDLDDKTSAEWSLIENLQREDLNPIDRAEAFDRLIVNYAVTHQEIASQLGIDRSSVSNFLRLNDLDAAAKNAVRDGRLAMGHAKVLLSIPEATDSRVLAKRCATEQWSVRELERQVKKLALKSTSQKILKQDPRAMFMENLSTQLGDHLGTRVKVTQGVKKGSGSLVISFYSNDQFEGILDRLQFKPRS